MNQDTLIDLNHISFAYHTIPVLQDINFKVMRGQFVGIIGPNGSGKTTLLNIILGLIKPTEGSVKLFGKESLSRQDRVRIGYVPQKAQGAVTGFPVSVEEVVSLGMVHQNASSDRINEALTAVGMIGKKKSPLNELSGGQQQRVFIARALVSRPELLILDEPTVGVDAESQSMFYRMLKTLNKESHLTLVLVSHDIDVVAHEVDEVACINCSLICHGKPKDVLKGDFMERLYGKDLRFIVHGH